MNLPVEVIDAVLERQCLVVVGSHLTAEAAAAAGQTYPLGKALAKELGWKRPRLLPGQRARVVAPSVLDAAAAIEAELGRETLERKLAELVDTSEVSPTVVHRFLVTHFPVIFSTCWDDLILRCGESEGIALHSTQRTDDLGELSEEPALVVNLRNQLGASPILTRADREAAPLSDQFRRKTRTLIRNQTVLFLGFRPEDEEFELLWEDLTLCFGGELPRCHLAVAQGQIDDVQWQRWVWRGVLLFMADPLDVVETLQREMAT